MENLILSSRQQQVVTHDQGPLIVCAGPGTGKTRTLVLRIARLLEQGRAAPEEIVAVTFTQKAAEEMRRRLGLQEGRELRSPGPWITTFHGLCLRLLKEYLPHPHQLLSEPQALSVLKEAVQETFPDFPLRHLKELSRRISLAKNHLLPPERAEDAFPDDDFPSWSEMYRAYQQKLSAGGWWDFDDLLIQTVALLEGKPSLREASRDRYPFVLVDEFQDINEAQYRLFRALTRPEGHWMVIGDPDQAIYGFRGSHPEFFIRLKAENPKAAWIVLEESFRLNRTVIRAGLRVLKKPETALKAGKSGPPGIPVFGLEDDQAEAEFIAELVEKEVGGFSFFSAALPPKEGSSNPRGLADIAVLYRLHAQGDVLAEVFARKGIPFQRAEEVHWAQRPETRLLLQKIHALKDERLTPAAAVEEALAGMEDPFWRFGAGMEILKKLRLTAATFRGGLEDFLEELSLLSGGDAFEPAQEAVALLTLHTAKGLEFPLVVISGCEDGLLPLSLLKESDAEEERRLFYVGLTRAVDEVILTWARKRTLFGRRWELNRSPFIEDIGSSLLEEVRRDKNVRRPRKRQLSLFHR